MIRPGKMLKEVLGAIFKKPATSRYPYDKSGMPDHFRGAIKFIPEKCIGCMMCVKDCPANAIKITKVGDKRFDCEIDMGKCIYCGQCVDSCMRKALEITKEFELAQLDRSKLKVTFHAQPQPPKEEPKPKA
jgi:formate hydrogenlyase subunit 6/NADH:ubiquinone oxidoreductase subunit I